MLNFDFKNNWLLLFEGSNLYTWFQKFDGVKFFCSFLNNNYHGSDKRSLIVIIFRGLILTDRREESKLVHRRKRSKMDASIFFFFFRRVRATSMTQRRVENTRVHFGVNSPVSVKVSNILMKIPFRK